MLAAPIGEETQTSCNFYGFPDFLKCLQHQYIGVTGQQHQYIGAIQGESKC
jgi:hypothetical protein